MEVRIAGLFEDRLSRDDLLALARRYQRDRAELIEVLGKTAGALDAALNSGGDWTIDAEEALSEVHALLSRLEKDRT